MKKAVVRHLPKDLTSYDFLKSLAVITMIIDYMGLYFYPDEMGWRLVGRMSMPIWMFLIGYANTREIRNSLYWGAGALFISNIVFGQAIFPLNILVTIMVTRVLIDYVMQFSLSGFQNMFMGVLALIVIIFPTWFIFEYGSQAILFAMFGYMVRHQKRVRLSNEFILVFMFVAMFAYVVFQKILMGFGDIEFYTMSAGVLLICLLMSVFQPQTYPELTRRIPAILTETFQLLGRQTLEIYVVSLLAFKIAVFFLYPESVSLFQVRLF